MASNTLTRVVSKPTVSYTLEERLQLSKLGLGWGSYHPERGGGSNIQSGEEGGLLFRAGRGEYHPEWGGGGTTVQRWEGRVPSRAGRGELPSRLGRGDYCPELGGGGGGVPSRAGRGANH